MAVITTEETFENYLEIDNTVLMVSGTLTDDNVTDSVRVTADMVDIEKNHDWASTSCFSKKLHSCCLRIFTKKTINFHDKMYSCYECSIKYQW